MSRIILLSFFLIFGSSSSLELAEQCSVDERGIPRGPKIILMGETGVGKSTLGNRLFKGYSDFEVSQETLINPAESIVEAGSYLDKSGDGEFGEGHGLLSHTNETVWKLGRWLGNQSYDCVTIMDTPGLDDTQNRTCRFTREIQRSVKDLEEIDGFIIVFKGETTRLTPTVRRQLTTLQEMFGKHFWKKAIIEITFWAHDERSRRRREGKRDEKKVRENWNKILRNEMNVNYDVPVVFIDPVIDGGLADPEEIEIFHNETKKVYDFIRTNDPYICADEEGCFNQDPSKGIPTVTGGNTKAARISGVAQLRWRIWFAEDCSPADAHLLRSYEIRKDNQTIYRMTESDIWTELPESSLVIDDEKSKYKTVILRLQNIQEDSFGTYSVKNIHGESEPVTVLKTVDGSWSRWSNWGACSKTCLSKSDNFDTGSRQRSRTCETMPQNGGRPCLGPSTETSDCASTLLCEGTWESWSPWSPCSRSCGTGTSERRRTCSDHHCKTITSFKNFRNETLPGIRTEVFRGGIRQINDRCNAHDCPKDRIVGGWSEWSCNSRCYLPGEKYSYSHTKTRTRTCQDFKYRPGSGMKEEDHPDVNQRCTSIRLSQTATGCPSSFSECPSLRKLVITVGADSYDGTNDWIKIRFRNNDLECCETDFLNYNSYGFSFDCYNENVTIDTNNRNLKVDNNAVNALGRCLSGTFRPDGGLSVQVEVTRVGLNAHTNGYRFSKIQATFGAETDPLKRVWTSGDTGFCDGCGYNGYSSWFRMW